VKGGRNKEKGAKDDILEGEGRKKAEAKKLWKLPSNLNLKAKRGL